VTYSHFLLAIPTVEYFWALNQHSKGHLKNGESKLEENKSYSQLEDSRILMTSGKAYRWQFDGEESTIKEFSQISCNKSYIYSIL
jgi:hypothetical protein